MELGDLITQYRRESGLTIDELAVASGVPKGTITKILGNVTKAPTLDTVRAIAHALGKTLADFDETSTADVSPLEESLLRCFARLNQEGQERLVDIADDMVSSGKYIKTHSAGLGKGAGMA